MTNHIAFEDFTKVDIRQGTIIEVANFPKAKKPAYQLTIDFGPLGIKKSSAQITDHYTKDELLNKQVTAIVNFKPKQIANFFSECLVLGVADAQGKIVLLQTTDRVHNGTPIN
ncbi:tRNA-binding protein [Flavobacteriaceae bacterium F08102]|nr:tRNA-binding protein [Flavobacteriaceae bacterium F08102]